MKRNAIFLAVASLFADAAFSQAIPVNTLPTGGVVRAGDATINAPVGSKLTIDQASKRALIDWASFDIGKDAWVHLNQTLGSTSITANRVPVGTTKTTIEGMLTAPGHVMVLNRNGVLFTGSAVVNVGGLTASTGQIDESHFAATATMPIGITGATSGKVENKGTITVADTGLVAFVAPSVVNSGVIIATKGRIVLASAEEATLSLNGNDLYELAVTKGVADGSIDNTGTLQATGVGGTIILSALDAANAVSGLINLEGVQQATRIEVHGGVVSLKSDLNATTVAGTSSTINVFNGAQLQDAVDIAKVGAPGTGAKINANGGVYDEQVTLNKANLTLTGNTDATLKVDAGEPGFNITAHGVTLEGMKIVGPYSQSFTAVDWNNVSSTTAGVTLQPNVNDATIRNNDIRNVRTGVQILGTTSGTRVTGNTIDNTKGSVLLRSDGVTVSGNKLDSLGHGNEWDIVLLNNVSDGAYFTSPHASQKLYGAAMMTMSAANGGMHILDRRYGSNGLLGSTPQFGNRSHILVSAGSSFTAADDFNLGNGLGNARQPLGFISAGINAVVAGGVVEVAAGTYTENLTINRALTLHGAGNGLTIIDPTGNTDAIVVTGSIGADATVAISDLAVQGGKIGIKVADDANLGTITLDRVVVRDNSSSGFISSSGGSASSTVANINILNSVFAGNGSGNGTADINLFRFNGKAEIKNVDILGTRIADVETATDYGLQIRGHGDLASMTAAGEVKLDNVRIAGTYKKAHLAIQSYSDGNAIIMKDVTLGGARTATTGDSVLSSKSKWSAFFSSDMRGALSLGNTNFAGGAFGFGDIRVGGGTNSFPGGTSNLRVNAENTTFSDVTRSHTAAGGDNFTIEGRVWHALDEGVGGVVTWQAGNLYVAHENGSIQRGITAATVGDTVNVQAGTYAENISISKAITLKGAGAGVGIGSSIIDPVSGDAVSISGNMGTDATLTIDGFTFRDAPRYGVNVAQDTVLKELKILNSDFRGNGQNGFAALGSSTAGMPGLTKVTFDNDRFVGNGTATPSSLGYGDILFDFFNGNATFKNLQITGGGEFMGIQMRGMSPTANSPHPAGTVEFDNVTIDGVFRRPTGSAGTWNPGGPGDAIHLLEYSSVAGVTFKDVVLKPGLGHGMFLEGLGTTLDIGNTKFDTPNTNLADAGTGSATTSWNIFVGSNGNNLVTKVDADRATFLNAADGFAIEDRVLHALDFSGLGLVTWNPGHLYVTQMSGSIQRGINAACECDTVHVGAGTFTEQLTINKSLILLGAGGDLTTVRPTSLAADASGMKSILTIGGGATTDVEVSGFTFKGPVPEINAGIFVRDGARARIHNNRLIDIRESVALSGNQRGIGIFVGRASLGTSGRAVIQDNYISGYQKGGIVVDGPNSQATITGNTVIGEGPTDRTAQNGIQASRGASAHIEGNTVRGNDYTPLGDEATGILIFTPGVNLAQGEITVGPNDVKDNEVGIWTNDPRSLTRVNLTGVSNNGRDAVADFGGGYTGQANLEYPAWAKSNTAMVNATTFGGASGDIVDAGGLKVTGWNAFASIQPAVNAVAAGASIDVASGSYAESVVLTGLRNLTFNNVTLQGLTIGSGAAGSGIRGSVTANGSTGFVFNAPVYLLGDTSLATTGANITLNGDVQGLGGNAYALSLNAGAGDVTMVSGGTAGNPLGKLFVASDDFTLLSTLWVTGYDINALGTVALSDHTLRSAGAGVTNEINAGGNVTGSTIAQSGVQIDAGGDVAANVTSQAEVVVAATNVSGNFSGQSIGVAAQETVNVAVNAPGPVDIHSGGPANVTGSAPALNIDAPSGSASGNFGQVTNTGGGLIEVNGKPTVNTTIAENANNSRVVPAEVTTGASVEPGSTAQSSTKVRRRKLEQAADVLANGESIEIDLSPSEE